MTEEQQNWQSPHGRRLPSPGRRTLIMGVLNTTPDSFSDGGEFLGETAARARARGMIAEGADVIDIGGESTRPGAAPVSAAEEKARVAPVIAALREEFPAVPLSIDTYKAEVAAAAIDAGADVINDVWGLRYGLEAETGHASPMARVAAEKGCPVILMHNRKEARYDDFWPEILLDLKRSLFLAGQAGIPASQIWLDPGFGFGKEVHHNLEILKNIDRIVALGYPVLLGTSRKSTIGKVLNRPVGQRQEGTGATLVWGIAKGCRMIRVHDVAQMRLFATMADAIREGITYPDSQGFSSGTARLTRG